MSLAVTDLTYAFGTKTALDHVSFSVAPGQFCALLGPNGAGKSTLFNLLTRLYTTRGGRIEIAGHDMGRTPRQALARMGVVFQSQTLDLDLTVMQNLRYFAALQGTSGAEATRRCEDAMDRLDIADRAGQRARDLNGGHRRRLELARALLHDPAVLLLDEPTVGLDAASRAALVAHVHDLAATRNLTVLWATHLTDEVLQGDRLVILHQGRILADGIAGEIAGDRGLQETFLALTGERAA
ncbi:ABC transporter ATP-binding protein [Mangrovicoccus sp. HB161399]|uniref:ABC transporter ATP-binding protein n=1 Tax=Mangrovicoccus sp. HB161399 TaxID=2720392 RepID=UPI00155736AB|nr:ABC transporter ATP-binding protein [Mangrovicoccus sp. HB161399]